MSDILCITNRRLCKTDFLRQIEAVCLAQPAGIVLREKDLLPEDYVRLAKAVLAICRRHQVPCILHSFVSAALHLHAAAIHLPLPVLRTLTPEERKQFQVLGASCHSLKDVLEAQRLGCTYVTAGHIFETDCKKGLPGRGLPFLEEICREASIPVYAIGGISPDKMQAVRQAGAAGACCMSSLMTCADPAAYLSQF